MLRQWAFFHIVNRLEQLDRLVHVERVPLVAEFQQPLNVRGQPDPFLHNQDETLTKKCHGGADLDKHIVVEDDMLFSFCVRQMALVLYMDDCRSA